MSEARPRVQWPATVFLGVLHVLALLSLPYLWWYGISWQELAFHISAYVVGGFGITVLYHRAWTHNAVQLARPLEYFFAAVSTFVPQMPARQWISSHIKHHDHTDEQDDPYNISRGFWWAHFEWIILAPVPPIVIPRRLESNPVIYWQERYYWPISTILNVALPVAISVGVGAPWWGGVLVSALRLVLSSHVVYCVNSVCHYWGSRPFTHDVSARDVWWFPFCLGEQYHNYHHAFPRDYRHGVQSWDFDPSKWLIWGFAKIGWAKNLVWMSDRQVEHARRAVQEGVQDVDVS